MTCRCTLGKQPIGIAAHRSDAGTRGDEDAIAKRIAQREQAVRAVELNLRPILEITEEIRKKTAFDAVQAQIKCIVCSRPAGHRVGARDQLSFVIRGHHGDELARGKIKALRLRDVEFKMLSALAEMPGTLESRGVV